MREFWAGVALLPLYPASGDGDDDDDNDPTETILGLVALVITHTRGNQLSSASSPRVHFLILQTLLAGPTCL